MTDNQLFSKSIKSSKVDATNSPSSHHQDNFYATFRPLAILCKIFGAFSLQNVLQANGHLLRYRWISKDTLWGPVLHTFLLTMHAVYERDPWTRLFLSYIVVRTALIFISFLMYDRHLPQLIASIETFDENCHEMRSDPEKRRMCLGKTWVFITIVCLIIFLLGTLLEKDFSTPLWLKEIRALVLVLPLFVRVLYSNTFMCLCCNLIERFKVVRLAWNKQIGGILDDREAVSVTSSGTNTDDVIKGEMVLGGRLDGVMTSPERRLERIRLLHCHLVVTCEQLNTSYGVLIALYFLTVFTALLADIYHFLYMEAIATVSQIIFGVFNSLSVLLVANLAGNLTKASQDIVQDLGEIPVSMLSGACQRQVQMFLSYLSANKVEINAAGFCTVNRGTLVSILIYMTTYIIVIIEFASDLKKITAFNSTLHN